MAASLLGAVVLAACDPPNGGAAPTPDDVDAPQVPGAVDDGTDERPAPVDLEDGRHATYLHAIDVDARTLTVDVVQFLTGQAAVDAYHVDHPDDPEGPPNDYYIVNANPRLRTLTVVDPVEVRIVELGQGTETHAADWTDLPAHVREQPSEDDRLSWSPYWVTMDGGVVVAIEEQYLP